MTSKKKAAQLNKEIQSVSAKSRSSGARASAGSTSSRNTRSSGSTASRSASGRKDTKNTRVKQPAAETIVQEERRGPGRVAASVIGVIISCFLELCLFNVFGTFGGWIRYGLGGLFGSMAYIFPILTGLLCVLAGMNRKKWRVIFFSVLLFLMLCTFAHLISSFSLNNRDVLSYFTASAKSMSGGGIIGGTIALGLYLMLSKTGAIIITILIMILCFFFLFEDQIKSLFYYIFSRDDEDDYDEEEEYDADYEEEPEEVVRRTRTRSRRLRLDEDYEDYEDYPEEDPYEEEGSRYIRSRQDRRRSSSYGSARVLRDDPVYITEDGDETIIRIRKNKKPVRKDNHVPMTRSTRKAQPMRDGSTDIVRSENKARGISRETDLMPHNANGDEIHEITRRNASARKQTNEGSQFFDQTLIRPADNEQMEWNTAALETIPDPREARVTSVPQAAVNRRAKEARPVKVSKEERMREREQEPASRPERSAPSRTMPPRNQKKDQSYYAPPMELLARIKGRSKSSEAELEKIAENLEIILEQFGVHATVTDIQAGPSVTRFELQPELGTRVNRITSLADDLKLNLGVTEIRIEAPIPGRQAVGIEIPNKNRQTVYMRELLEEPTLVNHPSRIAFAAGKDISGNVVVADIAKMPHLLVAGTTGSGKSVFLNTILMTILYRAKPSEVGLIIVDPKKVEFGVYQGIPHLMKDVVTDPTQAVSTLRWAVSEMTNRYQRMQMSAVRDFKSYNAKVEKGTVNPEEENPRKMNQIVIIIDELADLMMVAKKEAEALICRLAQLARAAGIHLIIATQRPSVDVVTGLIKANVPARVALLVSSQIDSRTIIDMPGAEKLLGNGDMLFYPTGYVKPVRVQGAFVSDDEIQMTVDYLIKNNRHDYFAEESKEIEKFMNSSAEEESGSSAEKDGDQGSSYDEYFYEAGKLCIEMGKASSSMLQRRFNLGFNRAARIIDQLEEFGAVGPQKGAKPREILVDTMTFEEMWQNR